MKKLISLMILLVSGVEAQNNAQQNNESNNDSANPKSEIKKRPSWSQGLPERQAKPTSTSLMTKPIADIDLKPSRETFKPELETPEIDLNFQPKPTKDFKMEVETVAVGPPSTREAMRESFYNGNRDKQKPIAVDSELLAQYKWQVLKVTNVEVPSDFDANDALNLNIHINPKGRVVKVVSEDADVSAEAMRMIEKSIKKWRFEPPANLGISANINKSFNVDIQAD